MKKLLATLFTLCLGLQFNLAAQEVGRDNIVVVLDGSGSMDGGIHGADGVRTDKMTAAKTALKKVMEIVPSDTNVGIVVFSSGLFQSRQEDWIYPLGTIEKPRLMQAIDQPSPGGGTPLGDYMKIGADRLLQAREEQHGYGTYRLLVITDGEADNNRKVVNYATEIINRGITLDVIGVDMDEDHSLATLANSYRRANDASSLTKVVSEVFAELGGSSDVNADKEAFKLLSGLPPEVGLAMLQAFTSSGNHPIGERPRVVARQQNNASSPSVNADTGYSSSAANTSTATTGGFGALKVIALVIAGLVALIGIVALVSYATSPY